MIISASLMVMIMVPCNRIDAWLPLAFFLISTGGLIVMSRQHRMLPLNMNFE